MKSTVLYEVPGHKCVAIGRDLGRREDVVDTNEFAIITHEGALLVDPGGVEIFPRVVAELSRHVDPSEVRVLFASHQDPDVVSSLPMWADLATDLRTYVSWMWRDFISHFTMGRELSIIPIPDEGMPIPIGEDGSRLMAVPAHFCHSPGNFSLYDQEADILFSGDIGAALLPDAYPSLFVEDFAEHRQYMRGFHQRWMPSADALKSWTRRVRQLSPKLIAPQHGCIFQGDDVERLLDWLEALSVGRINLGTLFTGRRQSSWRS